VLIDLSIIDLIWFFLYYQNIFNIRIFLSHKRRWPGSFDFPLPVFVGINMSRYCKTATNDSFWFKFKFSKKKEKKHTRKN